MVNLGQKLQGVHSRVNIRLGVQDGPITFKKTNTGNSVPFGKPYDTPVTTSLTITEGIGVEWVKEKTVKQGGAVAVGDVMLTIPANLVPVSWFTDSRVNYQGKDWAIKSHRPTEIYTQTVVQWVVHIRREGNTSG